MVLNDAVSFYNFDVDSGTVVICDLSLLITSYVDLGTVIDLNLAINYLPSGL